MTRLLTFADLIDGLTRLAGKLAAFMLLALVLLVGGNTLGRYALGQSSIALQELEWHLLLPVALIGISVLMRENGHVRVDMVYELLGRKTQAALDCFSMLVGVLVAVLFIRYSTGFVDSAWSIDEGSPDPGGLPARWALKGLMPVCFALMALQCLANAIRHLAILTGHTPATPEVPS
ncbi:MAG: TRAP transporter small permease subunit [Pseudomonadota bacterium]